MTQARSSRKRNFGNAGFDMWLRGTGIFPDIGSWPEEFENGGKLLEIFLLSLSAGDFVGQYLSLT